jgi:hypothetical protein
MGVGNTAPRSYYLLLKMLGVEIPDKYEHQVGRVKVLVLLLSSLSRDDFLDHRNLFPLWLPQVCKCGEHVYPDACGGQQAYRDHANDVCPLEGCGESRFRVVGTKLKPWGVSDASVAVWWDDLRILRREPMGRVGGIRVTGRPRDSGGEYDAID